jgi:hypothetical protein
VSAPGLSLVLSMIKKQFFIFVSLVLLTVFTLSLSGEPIEIPDGAKIEVVGKYVGGKANSIELPKDAGQGFSLELAGKKAYQYYHNLEWGQWIRVKGTYHKVRMTRSDLDHLNEQALPKQKSYKYIEVKTIDVLEKDDPDYGKPFLKILK